MLVVVSQGSWLLEVHAPCQKATPSLAAQLPPCSLLLCRAETPFQTSPFPSARENFPLGKAHFSLVSALSALGAQLPGPAVDGAEILSPAWWAVRGVLGPECELKADLHASQRGSLAGESVHFSGCSSPVLLLQDSWSWGKSAQHRPDLHGLIWAPALALQGVKGSLSQHLEESSGFCIPGSIRPER